MIHIPAYHRSQSHSAHPMIGAVEADDWPATVGLADRYLEDQARNCQELRSKEQGSARGLCGRSEAHENSQKIRDEPLRRPRVSYLRKVVFR